MTTGIRELLNNKQLPIKGTNKIIRKKLPIEAVDQFANELVVTYSNPKYRKWYCGVIYDFGFEQVHEWMSRAKEGKEPAKLFSKYVIDARNKG